jgi:hypothetical protein
LDAGWTSRLSLFVCSSTRAGSSRDELSHDAEITKLGKVTHTKMTVGYPLFST